MSTVYISAHKVEDARRLKDKLVAAGHTVVSTWHDATGPDDPNWKGTAEDRCERNFSQIKKAGRYVMIADEEHVQYYTLGGLSGKPVTGGKFVELGYAIASYYFLGYPRPYVVGGVENGMVGGGGVTVLDEDAFVASI